MINKKDNFFVVPIIASTFAIFALGFFVPLGVAVAVPYVFVVLLTLWIPDNRYPYITGIITTLLTLAGIYFAPEPVTSWGVVIANRIISLVGIWVAVFVVLRQKELEDAQAESKQLLKQMNATLEANVSERTKELTVAFNELEKSKVDLQLALRKEKELNEMKSRFITTASHEFRTPLSAVLSSSGLVEKYSKNGQEEKVSKHLIRIRSAVRELETILEDFLSLEKLESGKLKLSRLNFNVPDFCEDVVEGIRSLTKQGQFITYRHSGIEEIYEDKKILQHILLNLLSNACKYSEENKEILLETEVWENYISLKVHDKGIGIPADEHRNMFTKFFRAQNVTAIQGTGIGLNIVKQYVELVDGSITFSSAENEGTTFVVRIPLNKPD